MARPEASQIFYIDKNWSKDGMGEVLMQAGDSLEGIKSEKQERDVGKCESDNSLEGICLRHIYLILI